MVERMEKPRWKRILRWWLIMAFPLLLIALLGGLFAYGLMSLGILPR